MHDYPTVAHIKDHFLLRSETFIYNLIKNLTDVNSIILDRYHQQNADYFPMERHFSPAERFGIWAGWLERAALRYFGRSFYLEAVIKKHNADLLHAHFGQLGALFAPVAHRQQLPLVASFYGKDLSVFAQSSAWSSRFDQLWQTSERILALGPAMGQELESLGCPPKKITVLPLAIDVSLFDFYRRPSLTQNEPVRLLTVGRLMPKKGIDVLLKALAILRNNVPKWQLFVAGEGPQRSELNRLTQRLNLTDCVHFLGWLSSKQVAQQMARAHLFILASRRDPITGETEGTPTVLLEAQARGLPVIATYHADIPFIVQDRESGLLAPEGDAEALATTIAKMMERSNEWPDMGQTGRNHVVQRHDARLVTKQLLQIYLRCLHKT